MRACGQKLVKFCRNTHTDTHTTAAKLVVRIYISHFANKLKWDCIDSPNVVFACL